MNNCDQCVLRQPQLSRQVLEEVARCSNLQTQAMNRHSRGYSIPSDSPSSMKSALNNDPIFTKSNVRFIKYYQISMFTLLLTFNPSLSVFRRRVHSAVKERANMLDWQASSWRDHGRKTPSAELIQITLVARIIYWVQKPMRWVCHGEWQTMWRWEAGNATRCQHSWSK